MATCGCHCRLSTVEIACTHGHSDVRTHAARGPPAGDIYLSADLHCITLFLHLVEYVHTFTLNDLFLVALQMASPGYFSLSA